MQNPEYDEEYGIIHLRTGEIQPIPVYDTGRSERWEKVYAKTLADLLDLSGDQKTKVIAYMIRNKDYKNVVMASVRKIAEEAKVSKNTVQSTIQLLIKNKFMIRLQNGVLMFSPHIMRAGKQHAGIAVVRRWQNAGEIED